MTYFFEIHLVSLLLKLVVFQTKVSDMTSLSRTWSVLPFGANFTKKLVKLPFSSSIPKQIYLMCFYVNYSAE